jgi:phosphoglycolate phosphatase
MFAKPSAVLFDWDNTLVDTWPVIHAALTETLEAMGHAPWSLEKVKRDVKRSMRESFPELFGARWEEAAEIYQQAYRARHLEALHPLPQAKEVVERLQQSGIPLAVVSNKRSVSLRKEVPHLGWAKYFGATIGADDAARDKPSPDPALLALSQLRVAASADVWFVGDTVVDIQCAHAIGAQPILYGPHALDDATFEGEAIAAHVLDHADFLALLKRII